MERPVAVDLVHSRSIKRSIKINCWAKHDKGCFEIYLNLKCLYYRRSFVVPPVKQI